MCQTIAEPGVAHSPRCIHDTALILAYLSYRAMVDHEPLAEKNALAIPRLIRAQDINGLDASEIRFLNAPFGTLSAFSCSQASWLVEGLVVLAWTLCKVTLPSFSTKGDGAKAGVALGMFSPAELDKATAEDLRDFQEIDMGAVTYEAVFGRIMKHLKNPEKMDLANLLKDPATGHLLVDGLELTDGDLYRRCAVAQRPPRAATGGARDRQGAAQGLPLAARRRPNLPDAACPSIARSAYPSTAFNAAAVTYSS